MNEGIKVLKLKKRLRNHLDPVLYKRIEVKNLDVKIEGQIEGGPSLLSMVDFKNPRLTLHRQGRYQAVSYSPVARRVEPHWRRLRMRSVMVMQNTIDD